MKFTVVMRSSVCGGKQKLLIATAPLAPVVAMVRFFGEWFIPLREHRGRAAEVKVSKS